MLTVEMLKQSNALAGLTDDQLAAIAEMSRNDENTVIGSKIGALHGQYDADIFNITGMQKKEGEKSYDYTKRVLSEYKTKAEAASDVQKALDTANAKISDLEQKLEKNAGSEVLSQQLKDAKAQAAQLQEQLARKDADFNSKKAQYEEDLKKVHVDYAFKAATSGLKFKDGMSEAIQKVLLESALAEVLRKGSPDFVDQAGNRVLVLRDKEGNILNNPKNNLNPYTLEELVMETSLKDALDTGRQQTGAGTSGGSGGRVDTTILDLSGISTQVEADKVIEHHLLASGITRDSKEFAEQSLQLRSENNISALPLR